MTLESLATAGLFRRLASIVYDTLVVAALLMLAGYAALFATGGTAVPAGNNWFRLFLSLVAGGYFCGSWIRGGQTLGMRAWRLRLVGEEQVAVPPRIAILRLLLAALAWLPVGLGYLWVLVDPDRLAWHDRWTGTRIVVLPKR